MLKERALLPERRIMKERAELNNNFRLRENKYVSNFLSTFLVMMIYKGFHDMFLREVLKKSCHTNELMIIRR